MAAGTTRVVQAKYCGRFELLTAPPLFLVPATGEPNCNSFVTVRWHERPGEPPMAVGKTYTVETDGKTVWEHKPDRI